MPAKIRKDKSGYTVYTPNGVKGSGMTLENAQKQQCLLNAIEYEDGWRPTKHKGGLPKHKNRRIYSDRRRKRGDKY